MPKLSRFTRHAFTLIELLIVVAIIAILAAIAVPNFLEAQTRSKVSRVKSDMRTMITGIESYRVDNNKIFRTSRATGETREFLFSKMTTPVAYLTSIPKDPFNLIDALPGDRVPILWGPDYIEGDPVNPANVTRSATVFQSWPQISNGTTLLRSNFWVLFSLGPDLKYDVLDGPWPARMYDYDATNGTISKGDIIRFE